MKYAVLKHQPLFKHLNNKSLFNIGDNVQSAAVYDIYHEMGIEDKDIIEINKFEISTYDGEYAVLPMANYFFTSSQYGVFPISPKIIPVFVGFNLLIKEFNKKVEQQLRNYEPIGCRDEVTLNNLREHHIKAYLSGCITMTLSRREKEPKEPKTFFVDVPEEVIPYIPEKLKQNGEFITHMVPIEKVPIDDEEARRLDGVSRRQYERYKKEATLVVTSRLHCAAPCIAMGIPVILVLGNCAETFSWIDRLVHIYLPDEFKNIDWEPHAIDCEDIKKQLKNVIKRQIRDAYNKYEPIFQISDFYEKRERALYGNRYISELKKLKDENGPDLKCAVWGAIANTSTLLRCIPKVYEKYEVVNIIDEFAIGEFEGIKIESSEVIKDQDKDIIYFIIAEAAREYAVDKLKQLGRKFICITKNAEVK